MISAKPPTRPGPTNVLGRTIATGSRSAVLTALASAARRALR